MNITDAFKYMDKERACLEEAKAYVIELEKYQCDDSLGDYVSDGPMFWDIIEPNIEQLQNRNDVLHPIVRPILKYIKGIHHHTNRLTNPALHILLIMVMLKTVKRTQKYIDQLKNNDYSVFFDQLARDLCRRRQINEEPR